MNETHRQLDEQQNSRAAPDQVPEERSAQAGSLRTWTHYGGMVPQQESANKWIRQNQEIKMAANDKPGAGREGEGAQSDRGQLQAELQEARAAAEEARQREAAEKAREQERDRSGPER